MSNKSAEIKQEQPPFWIPGVKGFNKDLTCRGFQFKEGETFLHEGKASACNSGFHYCTNPLDVFNYYSPGESAFHQVHGGGHVDTGRDDDSKIACSEIHIGASISLHDIIGASMKFFFSRKYEETTSKHSEGNSSASSATGYSSASSATGDRSASSATGDRSASSATGYRSASSATGYRSASSATGYSSASSATGDTSAAVATGYKSRVMVGKFGALALAWWNEKERRFEMRAAITGCGDGSDGLLKANVWYQLNDQGEFVEDFHE